MYTVVLNWLTVMFFLLKAVIPTTTLQVKTFYVGENGTLSCNFVNSTKSVVWLKNNRTLSNNYSQTHDGRLIKFWRFEKSFIGIYSCHDIIKGFPGKILVAYNVSLATKVKLHFTNKKKMELNKNRLSPLGNEITFRCTAAGEGLIKYKWFKNNKLLPTRRVGSTLVVDQPTLKLKTLVLSDSAVYTCRAENKDGSIEFNYTLTVKEQIRTTPYLEKGSVKNQTRYVGDNTTIECYELISGTIPDFCWLKWKGAFNQTVLKKAADSDLHDVDQNVLQVLNVDLFKEISRSSSGMNPNKKNIFGVELVLVNLTVNDSGYYTCLASNHIGSDSANMYLNILPREVKLHFTNKEKMELNRNRLSPSGIEITFHCHADGEGLIKYKWFKNNKLLLTRRVNSTLVVDEPTLKLKTLVLSDSAVYACRAENKDGFIEFNYTLTVKEQVRTAPYLEKGSVKNQTRYVGDNTTIECYELISGTIPDFRWLKWKGAFNQTVLKKAADSDLHDVDRNFLQVLNVDLFMEISRSTGGINRKKKAIHGVELVLVNLKLNDSGYYTCLASNHIGSDSANMYLNVLPRIVYKNPPQPTKKSFFLKPIVTSLGVLTTIALIIVATVFYKILKLKKKTDRDVVAMKMLNDTEED
ncbi:titin-like [Hydractinia symbiolongicarpus]|uniref:titin-like n=1 Tax=Hydractinia symbiolongicarpus TaxID=13093 RepID=UPI00254DBA84|nr:titin-like [Hydractinia symbiolongicarpus]